MKTPSTDLFELIHSLSKTEKTYFKKFSKLHVLKGENNYMKLFDAIEKQKQYDEAAIKKKFAGEKFVKQLTFTKTYLYKMILKSMTIYSFEKMNTKWHFRREFDSLEFLMEKSLLKQSRKHLIRIKTEAKNKENFIELLQILMWEWNILKAESWSNITFDHIETHFSEESLAVEQLKNERLYFSLQAKVGSTIRKIGLPREKKQISKYDALLNNRYIKNEALATTHNSLLNLYSLRAQLHMIKNEFRKAYIDEQKRLQLEANPIFKDELNHAYASSNIIYFQLALREYKEVPLSIKKLKSLRVKSSFTQRAILNRVYYYELEFLIKTGQCENKEYNLQEAEKMILRSDAPISLMYQLANFFFQQKKYSTCGRYLNRIVNDEKLDILNNLFCFANLLLVIVYFEMGKVDLLGYTVRSIYRILYKRNDLYKVETAILNFLQRKAPLPDAQKKQKEVFKELKAEIEKIVKDPYEKRALDYFDLISWLESKIENRPFAEIVREKAKPYM